MTSMPKIKKDERITKKKVAKDEIKRKKNKENKKNKNVLKT